MRQENETMKDKVSVNIPEAEQGSRPREWDVRSSKEAKSYMEWGACTPAEAR